MRTIYNVRTGVTRVKTKARQLTNRFTVGAVTMFGVLGLALLPAANAAATVVYDNIPSPQPGNVTSQAFEATGTSEFGGQVTLAGTTRIGLQTTVLMSSWGCESGSWTDGSCVTTPGSTFSEPITLNVYTVNADNSVDSLLYTTTQSFNVPYRPSADATHCVGDDAGKWFNTADSKCYNGYATPISFNTTSVTWPNNAIVSVAYNTTHYGAVPYAENTACFTSDGGCGYDSLNVGLSNSQPTTGSDPQPNNVYANAASSYGYCDGAGDAGQTGVFRETAACWAGYQPTFRIATPSTSPTNEDQCKNNAWKNFNSPTFKNQGDCVSWVQHNVNSNGIPAKNR